MGQAVYASAIGTKPQITGRVAKNIADGYLWYVREPVHLSYAVTDGEDNRRSGPYGSIAVGKNGAVIAVGLVGQCDDADRRLTQTHHAVLSPNPNLLLGIGKQAQDRATGEQIGAGPTGEATFRIAKKPVSDGADPQYSIAGLTQGARTSFDLRYGSEETLFKTVETVDCAYPDGAILRLKNGLDPIFAIPTRQVLHAYAIPVKHQQG